MTEYVERGQNDRVVLRGAPAFQRTRRIATAARRFAREWQRMVDEEWCARAERPFAQAGRTL
jgi:hypothetical protein